MTAPRHAQQVRGREGDGPVRAVCEVLDRQREGAYWTVSLSSSHIAERARAGQFVNIATGAQSALLRRPFSISSVSRSGPAAGTVEVVFAATGPGTRWLSQVDSHDRLDVVGPLGRPFPLPRRRVPCLLVGGGYGVAPLFFLADALRGEGMRVDLIAGAASQDRLYDTIRAKRTTASVVFTTEDGSFGTAGLVTDVFDEVVERAGSAVVYACGPMPMLRAVSLRAAERDLPCQAAVEEHMACGVGVCWTCVVPTTRSADTDGADASGEGGAGDADADGAATEVRMRRACIDGPVFNAARIAWPQSRWHVEPEPEPARVPAEGDGGETGDGSPDDQADAGRTDADVWSEQ